MYVCCFRVGQARQNTKQGVAAIGISHHFAFTTILINVLCLFQRFMFLWLVYIKWYWYLCVLLSNPLYMKRLGHLLINIKPTCSSEEIVEIQIISGSHQWMRVQLVCSWDSADRMFVSMSLCANLNVRNFLVNQYASLTLTLTRDTCVFSQWSQAVNTNAQISICSSMHSLDHAPHKHDAIQTYILE